MLAYYRSVSRLVSTMRGEDERSNSILLRDLLLIVDIDLCKCDPIWLRVLRCQRFVGWSNSFTWPAPVGVDLELLAGSQEHEGYNSQSATTIVELLSSLLNCDEEPILTVDISTYLLGIVCS